MKVFIRSILHLAGYLLFAFHLHAQSPVLSSLPSAGSTLYLDFDGQYVKGGPWNWSGPIDAQASTVSVTGITEIYQRVSEDYRPFNITVTTDSNVFIATPSNKRMRVIITSTNWYGMAGGVAYVNSYSWGDDTPCWVFSSLLYDNPKWVAEACSHEAGHTFGLQHQSSFDVNCDKTAEYNGGQGAGEIGWAPIMGVSYYKNLTTWNKGPNTIGCNSIQSDIDIIASRIGLRADDYADSVTTATPIVMSGLGFSLTGLINKSQDIDAFSFELPSAAMMQLNAIPQNVGNENEGANIDISVTILNELGDTIGMYNPSSLLSAGIDTALNSGKYYLLVKAVGNANHSDYGGLGLYALNGMMLAVLPVHQFVLKGNQEGNQHLLSWSFVSDEKIKELQIEVSADGKKFRFLSRLNAGTKTYYAQPQPSVTYYRVKAITANGDKPYYSNTIALQTEVNTDLVSINTMVMNDIQVKSKGRYTYHLFDATGRMVQQGNIEPGVNYIQTNGMQKGIFYIRISNGNEGWTEKLIKQ